LIERHGRSADKVVELTKTEGGREKSDEGRVSDVRSGNFRQVVDVTKRTVWK
jgi:hypothetical protein